MGNQVSRTDKRRVEMPQHAPMKIARKPQRAQETANKLPSGELTSLSKIL